MKLYNSIFEIANDPPKPHDVWAMYLNFERGEIWEVNIGPDHKICEVHSEDQAVLLMEMFESCQMKGDDDHFIKAREAAMEALALHLLRIGERDI